MSMKITTKTGKNKNSVEKCGKREWKPTKPLAFFSLDVFLKPMGLQ